jgi:hypothetical protein
MATTTHRRPILAEMTFVVAVSTTGRTVVRPYTAPKLILTQPHFAKAQFITFPFRRSSIYHISISPKLILTQPHFAEAQFITFPFRRSSF